MRRLSIILVVPLWVAWVSALAQEPAATTAGSVERGKEIYLKVGCDQCHGREAQGSPITAPKLGPSPLPIAAFRLFIRKPRVQMPPYGTGILSDTDVDDIYAYVGSRAAPVANERLPN